MAFSGISAIEKAIDGLDDLRPDGGLFLELLACEGGCVNGPRTSQRNGTAVKRCRILRYGQATEIGLPRPAVMDIQANFAVPAVPAVHYPGIADPRSLAAGGKTLARRRTKLRRLRLRLVP